MRQLSAQLGPGHTELIAETKAMNTQIAVSLQRQRRILQSALDRGEGSTAEDRKILAEYLALIVDAQAELRVGELTLVEEITVSAVRA